MARYGNFILGTSAHAVLSTPDSGVTPTISSLTLSRNYNMQRKKTQKQLPNITSQFEMWENTKQSHCVNKRSSRKSGAPAHPLIAQTSYHTVFSPSFSKCGQVLSDTTQMEITAAWLVKVSPYNLVRKKWESTK